MRLNEIEFNESAPIDGYGPGFFRVGGTRVDGPVVVAPSGVKGWGGYDDTDALIALGPEVDVIIIGTGAEIAHLPGDFRKTFDDANIGVEAMASPAACRTYNVLLSEGRRVAVALIPV